MLYEMEPGLLAQLFSSCDGRTLLNLEIALGVELGRGVCTSMPLCRTWAVVLREEGGVSLAGGGSCSSTQRVSGHIPPVPVLKDALHIARFSSPIDGGWHEIEPRDLSPCTSTISQLHASFTHGRRVLNPGTGSDWGNARRISLNHFDVHRCFEDGSWDAIVDSFRRNTQLREGAPSCVRSSAVPCTVGGSLIQLSLVLSAFPDPVIGGGPPLGIFLGLDIKTFSAYFEQDASQGFYRNHEVLHVVCTASYGGLSRKSDHILIYFPGQGAVDVRPRPLWHLAPLPNFGLALSIEVLLGLEGDCEPILIDEEVANAQWNNELPHGTDLVPLVYLRDNEFASRKPAPGELLGAIALIRRGGGCGFAQKALAAESAGAVGCIIYELQGDREMLGDVHTMGQEFGGIHYPSPQIPCVMVHASDGRCLFDAAMSAEGARARINFGRSEEQLRRLPQSFDSFRQVVAQGGVVHLAVLVEQVRDPRSYSNGSTDFDVPWMGWFD